MVGFVLIVEPPLKTSYGAALAWDVDLVLVVVGVRPDTDLLIAAGA